MFELKNTSFQLKQLILIKKIQGLKILKTEENKNIIITIIIIISQYKTLECCPHYE